MKIEFKQLAGSIWPLLLLALFLTGAHAQDQKPKVEIVPRPSRDLTEMAIQQPPNSIQVHIRYKKELGYRSQRGRTGPTSCSAFAVFAKLRGHERQPNSFPIDAEYNMRDNNGYYVCDFLVKELPLNVPLSITASLSDERSLPTETWKGGSQPQPPEGLRRVISDSSRAVTLTDTKTRDTLYFEMVYGPPER